MLRVSMCTNVLIMYKRISFNMCFVPSFYETAFKVLNSRENPHGVNRGSSKTASSSGINTVSCLIWEPVDRACQTPCIQLWAIFRNSCFTFFPEIILNRNPRTKPSPFINVVLWRGTPSLSGERSSLLTVGSFRSLPLSVCLCAFPVIMSRSLKMFGRAVYVTHSSVSRDLN